MTLREAHPPVETLEVFESIVFFLAVLYILQQECRMTLREAQAPVEALEVFESIVFFSLFCIFCSRECRMTLREAQAPVEAALALRHNEETQEAAPQPCSGRAQNNDDQHHGKHQQDDDQHHGNHRQDEHHPRFLRRGEDHHHGSQEATNITLHWYRLLQSPRQKQS